MYLKELSLPIADTAPDEDVQFILDFFINKTAHIERCGLACDGLWMDQKHLLVYKFDDRVNMILETLFMKKQEKGTTHLDYKAPIEDESQL